jgi:hypothetical protein
METLSVLINSAVITAVGVLLGFYTKGRLDKNDQAIKELRETVDARMDAFQRSLDAMRSDLTQVALAVGAGRQASSGG